MFCQIPRCGIVSADVVVLLDVLALGLLIDGGVDDIAAVCLFVYLAGNLGLQSN